MRLFTTVLLLTLAAPFALAGPDLPLAPEAPVDALRWAIDHADTVVVEKYEPGARRAEPITLRLDTAWRSEMKHLLVDASFEPRGHCLCISPAIIFKQGDIVLAQLSVHHGEKLRLYINDQYGQVSGDFFVGEGVGMGFVNSAAVRRQGAADLRAAAETAAQSALAPQPH